MLRGDDIVAVQHHQPVHGPDELRVTAPQRMRRGIGSASSAALTMPGSSVDGGSPRAYAAKYEELTLGVSTRASEPTSTPQYCGELECGPGGPAVLLEGRGHRRAPRLIDCAGCARPGRTPHREAARRRERTDRAVDERAREAVR